MTTSACGADAAFVLPPDVLLVPVQDLAPATRAQFAHDPGDVAVMRPRLRHPCRLVSADVAALVQVFRQPARIVDAVLAFSRSRQRDPAQVLDGAFEALQSLVNARVLAPAGSIEADTIGATVAPGQLLGGFEITAVVQVLEDAELYRARAVATDGGDVALKLLRPGFAAHQAQAIAREAAILQHLQGCCSPRLVATGDHDGRPWLAAAWVDGCKLSAHAASLRGLDGNASRQALHELGIALLTAYTALHEAGVVHADVHGGNVLVASDGGVTLVDFGASRLLQPGHAFEHADRSSVPWFYEPEAAAALRDTGVPCPATPGGEQVALATLLHHLHTGAYPVQTQAELPALLDAIAQGRRRSFAACGAAPWPALEAVLTRAAHADPAQRYASTRALLHAVQALTPPDLQRHAAPTGTMQALLRQLSVPGALFEQGLPAPRASVAYGAAGVATFLRRLALLHDDAGLLAQADAWARRADGRDPAAFEDTGLGITAATIGRTSPWHGAAGVHAAQAQVARARGDAGWHVQAVQAFVQASRPLAASHDATLGLPATLLAATLLHADAGPSDGAAAAVRQPLQVLMDEALLTLEAQIGSRRTLAALPALHQLGMAHGWAGLLHAVLRASQALGRGVPGWVPPLLDALAAHARPVGRGRAWPTLLPGAVPVSDESDLAPGWCRGSAGHVHLWLCAHAMTGQPRWLDLAVQAGQHTAQHHGLSADLCCGLAGRGYALLALYRHTGDSRWLRDARALAERAATVGEQAFQRPFSLLRGQLGVALLGAELDVPEDAAMPFFAAEAPPA